MGGTLRTVVAAGKLAIPTSRGTLVSRPALRERLSSDYRLALVSAPAGYGKTATLAAWAAERTDSVAWLSCDPSDAEPRRFMSCLLSAVTARWQGAADDAFVILERAGADTYDAAVAVANELAAIEGPGAIVIDDLHLAAPAPVMLTAFIQALPANFRLVVGTRSDPPLSLARFRLHGELLELRGPDLRFGPSEMSEFFELLDMPVVDDDLMRLHELTEGWPAGAQLAAIALQRAGRDHFWRAFSSTDRAVSDFLVSEVLASLPPDLVDFLVETSVLDAFDAELCAAVTGVEEAAAMLERLLAANLFVVALDERSGWYRYHHLFASFLRARLSSLGASRRRSAHDRACRALEERGDIGGAVRQAIAIGDTDRGARIVRAAALRTMSMSEGADVVVEAVRTWLHEAGAEVVKTDPAWVVELVIGLTGLSRADEAPSWLARVRLAHPDADEELTALLEGAWAEHYQHRGQPLEAIRHIDKALEALGGTPPDRGLLSLVYAATARAHIQAGQLDLAGAVVGHALAHPTGNAVADEVRNRGIAAYVAAVAGDLSRAQSIATSCRDAADRLGLGRHEPGRIYAGMAEVEVHLERNDVASARRLLDEVKRAAEASQRLTMQSPVMLQQARLATASGDETRARAALTEASLCYAEPDAAFRHVLGAEAVAQAWCFQPSEAAALMADLDENRVDTRVWFARLALAEHDDRTAARLLAELPPATTRRTTVERAVLCALSVLEQDVDRANTYLGEAIDLAQPEWLVRTIIDQGPVVHRLLASFPAAAGQEGYVRELLTAAGAAAVAPQRMAAQAKLVDPLSAREVTVLRYLCSRLTYSEIAAALFVSLNTLKSHVRAVYRKLGVASRADAVDVGRQLGVI